MSEETINQTLTLHQKLLAVKRSVEYLVKEDRNEHQKFNYVSSVQVLNSVRAKMNELGVLLEPRIETVATETHGKQILTQLWLSLSWIDTESQENISYPWYAQGLDGGEKGVGKALTYAEKYFILKYFNIPTPQDDPDANSNKIGNGTSGGNGKSSQADSKPDRNVLFQDLKVKIDADGIDPSSFKVFLTEKKKITGNGDGPDMKTISDENLKSLVDKWDTVKDTYQKWSDSIGM